MKTLSGRESRDNRKTSAGLERGRRENGNDWLKESSTFSPQAPGTATDARIRPTLHARAVSHPGITRQHLPNEDAYLWMTVIRQALPQRSQLAGLFLVADGVGGLDGGAYASNSVLEEIRFLIEADLSNPCIDSSVLKERLHAAIQQANRQLCRANKKIGISRGTTLTGTLLIEQPGNEHTPSSYLAHVVNIGDSRTYWYSTVKGVIRITRDHSLVEELIANGTITPEERYTHRQRNVIYRCLGDTEQIEIDSFSLMVQPGDRLLICSDGLWEMIRDADLTALLTLSNNEPSVLVSHMLHAALNRGGHDNITAIVITVTE